MPSIERFQERGIISIENRFSEFIGEGCTACLPSIRDATRTARPTHGGPRSVNRESWQGCCTIYGLTGEASPKPARVVKPETVPSSAVKSLCALRLCGVIRSCSVIIFC